MTRSRFLLALLALSLFVTPLSYAQQALEFPEQESASPTTVLQAGLSQNTSVVLTLSEALKLAQEQNPLLQAEYDKVDQKKAQYQTRWVEMLPDITLSYNAVNYDGAIQGFGTDVFQVDRHQYQPQAVFRFPVFQGGRKWIPMRAAKKTLESQQATAQSIDQQTLQQTALAYYELVRTVQLIDVAQKQVLEANAQMEINQARMDAGSGTRLDVLQSQAQQARAKQQYLDAERAAQIAATKLNQILNLPTFTAVIPKEMDQAVKPLIDTKQGFAPIVNQAFQNRPEVKALDKQYEALKTLRKLVFSAYLPEVAFQTRLGSVGPTFDGIKPYDESSFSVNLSLPNLALPALTRYKENGAQIDELMHRIQAQRKQIEQSVSEAFLQAQSKEAQIDVAKLEVSASELALSDAFERLKAGVGRNIDVLDAQTSATRARSNLASTITAFNQAQVNLVTAMGLANIQTLTTGITLP